MELLSWRPKNNPRSNSSKPNNIGGAIVVCKKHPKHQQSPGVCSVCLSEKLSLLCKPSRKKKKLINSRMVSAASHDYDEEEEEESSCSSSSYSPSQCTSCASSSACSSPVYDDDDHHHHHRLMKSRSMAAAVITARRRFIRERITEGTMDRHGMEKEKKRKFWSKLLRRGGPPPRGKKIEEATGLAHSRTMREMLSTAAH